jgi:hypothetical protein
MATSDILGIWNNAVGNIGVKTSIASLTEQSAEAAACALNYENVTSKILRETDWNCIRQTVALTDYTSTLDPPARWSYRYSYPSNTLRIWRMENALGVLWRWPYPQAGFEVLVDPAPSTSIPTRYICSNWTSLKAICGVYAYDSSHGYYEANFDSSLKDAIAWDLAAAIAGPLTGDARIIQTANQQAAKSLAEAQAANGSESAPNMQPDSESLSVRGYADWPYGYPTVNWG